MSWNRKKVDIRKKIKVLHESDDGKSQEKAELKYCRITMFAGSLRLLVANMLCLLTHILYLSA